VPAEKEASLRPLPCPGSSTRTLTVPREIRKVPVEAALLDDDFARAEDAAHEKRPHDRHLRFRQALESAQAVHRDLTGQRLPRPVRPDDLLLRPFERRVGVGEEPVAAQRARHAQVAQDSRHEVAVVRVTEEQAPALSLQALVYLDQDARAGGVELIDSSQVEHHVIGAPGRGRLDAGREVLGRAEEDGPFQLEDDDPPSMRGEDIGQLRVAGLP